MADIVVNMAADIEVDKVANMEVEKVDDMEDKVDDISMLDRSPDPSELSFFSAKLSLLCT